MFKRIDHVELMPSDFEKTISFYTDILGFKIKERHKVNMSPLREIIYLTLGDTMIEILDVDDLEKPSENPYKVSYNGLALEVDNMDETVAYLKEKGIEMAWGPMNIGGPIRAEIRDPDGLTIELRQW